MRDPRSSFRWSAAILLHLVLWAPAAVGQLPDALSSVEAAAPGERAAIVERLLGAGTPLIHGGVVTFLAEGRDGRPPILLGDFNWFGRYPEAPGLLGGRMEALEGTDWWYAELALPPDARIEYRFAWPAGAGMESFPDPHNPRQTSTFGQLRSVVEMPGYRPSPWVRPADEPLAGRLEPLPQPGGPQTERRIEVYLPPGYPRHAPYATAYFNDGGFYVDQVGAHRIVDAMVRDGALRPLIAVFVDPVSRRDDYSGSEAFLAALSGIVAQVDESYETARAASQRAILGGSRGATGALHAAFGTEGLFELCGLLEPAIFPDPILQRIDDSEQRRMRLSVLGGLFDVRFIGDYYSAVDTLLRKGYALDHRTAAIGHSPTSWRHYLPQMLIDLFGDA